MTAIGREDYLRYDEGRYGGYERDARIPGGAPRKRPEYGMGRPNFGSARSDYGRRAYGGRLDGRGMERGRGWWDRASDGVSSWFGDGEAERRRSMDERVDEGRWHARRWSDSRHEGAYTRAEKWRDLRARDVMTSGVACARPDDPAARRAFDA